MDNRYKLINAHVFMPAFKNIKQRLELLYCNAYDKCDYYKNNECVCDENPLGGVYCPHSKRSWTEGYTSRAKNFYEKRNRWKKQYANVFDKIKSGSTKIAKCGDYVYIPLPWLVNYSNSLDFIQKKYFIHEKDFTIENMIRILSFNPRALMGGVIDKYQEVYIPTFLREFKKVFPEMYVKIKEKEPNLIKEKEEKYSPVGRKAILTTCKKGTTFTDYRGNSFLWDGENLISEKWSSAFLPFDIRKAKVTGKPRDGYIVEITDENQVDENTVFV